MVDADGTGVRAVDVGDGVEVADGFGVLVALGVGVAFGVAFGDVVAFAVGVGLGVAAATVLDGVEGVATDVAAAVVVTAVADDGEVEGATAAVDPAADDAGALPLETALEAGAAAPELDGGADAGAAELPAAEADDDADAEWCLLLQPASASTTIMEPATTAEPRRARVRVMTLLEPAGDPTDDLL